MLTDTHTGGVSSPTLSLFVRTAKQEWEIMVLNGDGGGGGQCGNNGVECF